MILLAFAGPVLAQPSDCAVEARPSATMPLFLDLQGLPGVKPGRTGSVGLDIPTSAPGIACTDAGNVRDAARDPLAGPPGDVLHGPASRDLLRGSTPRIEIQTR